MLAQRRAQSPLAEADSHDRGQVTEGQDRELEPAEGGQAGAGEEHELEPQQGPLDGRDRGRDGGQRERIGDRFREQRR